MTGSRSNTVVLQDRDRKLLNALGDMRLIDRELAKVVGGFNSTTRANTRLLALTRAGLLRRVFTGTIAGGRKAVYMLSRSGAALADVPAIGIPRAPDEPVASILFLNHQMGINRILCSVKFRPIPREDILFVRWLSFDHRVSQSVPLVPDGYFELSSRGEIRPMFVEVDQGSESLKVWQRKVELYLHFAISGEFTRIFGHRQFRTVVVAPSARRLETIRRTIAKSTEKIFRLTTSERIDEEGLWSAVWLRPQGDQSETLI
jgi:hypothetical protein